MADRHVGVLPRTDDRLVRLLAHRLPDHRVAALGIGLGNYRELVHDEQFLARARGDRRSSPSSRSSSTSGIALGSPLLCNGRLPGVGHGPDSSSSCRRSCRCSPRRSSGAGSSTATSGWSTTCSNGSACRSRGSSSPTARRSRSCIVIGFWAHRQRIRRLPCRACSRSRTTSTRRSRSTAAGRCGASGT